MFYDKINTAFEYFICELRLLLSALLFPFKILSKANDHVMNIFCDPFDYLKYSNCR